MRWVENSPQSKKSTVKTACCTRVWGYVLMAAGILMIFLCMPFRAWMILLGAALIAVGYLLAFGR